MWLQNGKVGPSKAPLRNTSNPWGTGRGNRAGNFVAVYPSLPGWRTMKGIDRWSSIYCRETSPTRVDRHATGFRSNSALLYRNAVAWRQITAV